MEELISKYIQRLKHYAPTVWTELPDPRRSPKTSPAEVKRIEGDLFLKQLLPGDHLVLLDENGRSYRSTEFAGQLQKWLNASPKRLVFLIGGPYGFSEEVRNRAASSLSLSPMTFSHQIVRPLFLEQLYRAFTILRNEPYHHE